MSGTVVKGNWKQIPKTNPAKAAAVKAHLRRGMDYYQNRPDQDGVRADRVPFTQNNDSATRDQTHQVIDQSQERYAYRMVISPDPEQKMNAEQLREWTRAVMREAQTMHKIDDYAAVAHTKQTNQPHVHVVAVADGKFTPEEFKRLRDIGDREQARILERDQAAPKSEPMQQQNAITGSTRSKNEISR
jgi:hypothetical protein